MIVLANESAGVVSGGWGYIIAAYVTTWVFLGGYAISLFVRARESEDHR